MIQPPEDIVQSVRHPNRVSNIAVLSNQQPFDSSGPHR